MNQEIAIISIHADDFESMEIIKDSLLENNREMEEFMVELYNENETRGMLDNEWFTFALMFIPVLESSVNITEKIKDFITNKINKKMLEENSKKIIHTKYKISIPFFSYEREEEIILESKTKDE